MVRTSLVLVAVAVVGCSSAASEGDDPDAGLEDAALDGASDAATDVPGADGVVDGKVDADGEGETGVVCPTPPIVEGHAADRGACKFGKGDKVEETLGITAAIRAKIPLQHLVIVMNENRSFDHYFGTLASEGQPEAEGFPATFSNKDAAGKVIKPFHLGSTCLERDPPHGWDPMHAKWNNGKMDGFVTASDVAPSNGHYAMGYYKASDLPFYNFLAKTWAISDRYFASVIGPTWPNRDYLYAGTSDGVVNTFEREIDVPTVFDALDAKKVKWGIYGDGGSRAGCAGVRRNHKDMAAFFAELAAGTLPPIAFLDPTGKQDEHPPDDIQGGEAWARKIYEASIKSKLWPKMALLYTYDEGGGLFDHVPPPKACLASASEAKFDRLGFRVPLLVVSPYARPHFVSHKTYDHTSILRLVELLHDLPALTGRDANSGALLDLFDFACPTMLDAPTSPAAGKGGCP
jgi:phospholipase C